MEKVYVHSQDQYSNPRQQPPRPLVVDGAKI
jgi:hypothetical protein